jgi:hypothetical protein
VPSKAVPRPGACLLKLSGGAAGEELLKGTPVIVEVLPLASSATGKQHGVPGRRGLISVSASLVVLCRSGESVRRWLPRPPPAGGYGPDAVAGGVRRRPYSVAQRAGKFCRSCEAPWPKVLCAGDVGPWRVLVGRSGLTVARGPRADAEQRIESAHRAIEIREKRRRGLLSFSQDYLRLAAVERD